MCLDGLDHFFKEVLPAKGYRRYVDDFALFHDDPARQEEWRERISRYLEGRRLHLHPGKTVLWPIFVSKTGYAGTSRGVSSDDSAGPLGHSARWSDH